MPSPKPPPWDEHAESARLRREIVDLIDRLEGGEAGCEAELARALAAFSCLADGSPVVLYRGVVYCGLIGCDYGSIELTWRVVAFARDEVVDLSAPRHTGN
ncbi:hypothetical protein [Paludisphaera soli]|uniref:hypothetical protein n=1 Tax=Paludisphaera soli TaxID=2712865 RepID=UPI0013ED33AD|nr:hypothetical protein [Paludisphaera soli]